MTDSTSLELPPLYESLTWLTPLSEERAAHHVAFLSDPAPTEVLDMGCGWGELLLRVLTSAPQPLDYAAALRALRALVLPGGRLVYGEAIWSATPHPAATALLNGRDDEYLTQDALREQISAAGFEVVDDDQASVQEWDVFEAGYRDRFTRWLEANDADHPAAEQVRRQYEQQRAAYEEGYRGVLGMAYFRLRG
ncbi:hypothetical protein [Paenarthrobacter nitroguajacolicus]|uniref:hypothetical protein n=1 Tax=Paenarthrobacter nitroguajacolicus TaxID=211146 RepID=UPI000B155C6A|nr:hypothetical protein [Paenarthrobacter nitroguajacolicus]